VYGKQKTPLNAIRKVKNLKFIKSDNGIYLSYYSLSHKEIIREFTLYILKNRPILGEMDLSNHQQRYLISRCD